ncbi:MAG: hypothetical protein JW867_07605 [Candidatus Omnitrophica bacterium]|nr:hypothetical protein [Candidatus Omnitrophota bacterium]
MVIFIFLGIIASVFQLTLLREFTFSVAKNELSLVVACGIWLIFSSLGSIVGFRLRIIAVRYLALFLSFVFGLCLYCSHLGKLIIGAGYYEIVSFAFGLFLSIICLGPVGFLIGYCFAQLSRFYLKEHPSSLKTYGRFFAYEAIGFFAGGVVFTFFLCKYTNPFLFLFLPLLFAFIPELRLSHRIIASVFICCLSSIFIINFMPMLEKEFQGAQIIDIRASVYGPLIVTQRDESRSLYLNGSLLSSSDDEVFSETFIHTILSAHKDPKKILFIGHAQGGYIQQLIKHRVQHVDCVDISAHLIDLVKRDLDIKALEKVSFIVDDPRAFIRKNSQMYDCIIMNISSPSNLNLNRYFSLEFFQMVRARLEKEGIFSFYIPSRRDIMSPQFVRFNSCIINTIENVFKERMLIPADPLIIVASDHKLPDRKTLLKTFIRRRIAAVYFTRYHLQDLLDTERSQYLEGMLDKKVRLNQDLHPNGFLYYLLLEQAKFYPNINLDVEGLRLRMLAVFALLSFILALASCIARKGFFLINVGLIGFASIGVTSILFVLFQLYSGALFWKMGILIGLFMIGLSMGAFLLNTFISRLIHEHRALIFFYCGWAIFVFVVFIAIEGSLDYAFSEGLFYFCSLLCGLFTGAQYPLMSKSILDRKLCLNNIASSIYTADLIGAFLGTIGFSLFFIPFLGVFISFCLLVGVLCLFMLKSIFR